MNAARRERLGDAALGMLGIAGFLAAWEVVGRNRLLGLSWPPLSDVLAVLFDPSRLQLFGRALMATLSALATGYAAGLMAGLAAATAAHLVPPLKPGLDRINAVIHSLPSIATAPLLILFFGRGATPATLAALACFFVIYVAATSGLGATPPALRDLMQVIGAGRLTTFLRLELPTALPGIANGLRLAAPSALIGVIIGEWFGAPRGLGVLIINAMQNFQIPLLWSAVLLAVVTSLCLYGLLGLVQRAAARAFQ